MYLCRSLECSKFRTTRPLQLLPSLSQRLRAPISRSTRRQTLTSRPPAPHRNRHRWRSRCRARRATCRLRRRTWTSASCATAPGGRCSRFRAASSWRHSRRHRHKALRRVRTASSWWTWWASRADTGSASTAGTRTCPPLSARPARCSVQCTLIAFTFIINCNCTICCTWLLLWKEIRHNLHKTSQEEKHNIHQQNSKTRTP